MKLLRTLKRSVPLLVFASAIAFFGSGCSHSLAPTAQKVLPLSTTTWTDPGFANPNNPYDSIGLQHNQTLHYIGERLGSVRNDDTLYPGTDTLAVNYIDSIKGFSSDSLNSFLYAWRKAITHQDSLMAVMPTIFGPQATAYFWRIDSIAGGDDSLLGKLDSIESIESAASNELTGDSLVFVQVCAAVARYSASYWASADTTLWVGWQYHQRAIVDRQFRKDSESPAWWLTAAADVMGVGEGASEFGAFWGAGAVAWGIGTVYSLGSGAIASASVWGE